MFLSEAGKREGALSEPVSILLVEDDAAFAELVRVQLRRMPWIDGRLEVAGTLQDALKKLGASNYGLVITDLNLPDSSGPATVDALSRKCEQPIIVLTGGEEPRLRAATLEAGAYDFVSKDQMSSHRLGQLVRLAAIQASTYRSLRESEERFRSLSKLSADVYWEQDDEFRFTRFTRSGGEGEGLRGKGLLGKHRWDAGYVNLTQEEWRQHRAVLEAHQPFHDLELCSIENGEAFWISTSGEPVLDRSGSFIGYRGVGKNITARKKAEDELKRFRLAMDSSADMIVLIDRASMRFVDVNRTACRLLGYSRDELLALGPQDVLPVSREQLEATYDGLIADPSAVSGMNSHYRCKDGSLLPFESTRRVLRSGDSWIIAAISRDIRERIASEEALRRNSARLAEIIAVQARLADAQLDLDAVCDLLVAAALKVIGVGAAAIQFVDDGQFVYRAATDGARHLIGMRTPMRGNFSAAVVSSGQPVKCDDAENDPRIDPAAARRSGARALIGAPLQHEGKVIGVLKLMAPTAGIFTEDHVHVLQVLAGIAGSSIQRTQAQAALRSSEARFRGLTNLSADFYWEADAEHRITRTTYEDKHARTLRTQSQVGKRRWELPSVYPDPAGWQAHRALLEERRPFRDFELARVDDDGSERWFSVSGEPVFDVEGRFTGYRGVGRDISERKREERLVALEHAVTRALAEASTSSAAIRTVMQTVCESEGFGCGRYFYVDEEAQLLRFAEAWAIKDPDVERFVAKSSSVVYRKGQGLSGHAWQTGEPLWVRDASSDSRASGSTGPGTQGGSMIWPVTAGGRTIGVLSFSSGKVRDPDERLLRMFSVIGSQVGQFLQRKQAESEVLRSEASFRQTFELAGSGIAHVAMDGRFLRVNRKLCDILGYSERELMGLTVKQVSHPEDRDLTDAGRMRLHTGEADSMRFRKRYLRKQGSVVWVDMTISPVRDANGATQYEIAVLDDITFQQEAAERQATHLRYQERIARLGQSALGKGDAADLLHQAVRMLHITLDADAVAYLEAGQDGSQLAVRAIEGVSRAQAGDVVDCAEGDAALQVIRSESRSIGKGSAALSAPWAEALRCAALIPVHGVDGARGLLLTGYRRADSIAPEDINFIEAAAGVLSTGLQRIESESRLAFLAQFDPLTGLPNRALLSDRFSQMIVQARRHGSRLGVLFVDLDGFKLVNDTLGHAGGDELLKEAAVRLQSVVRPGDTVARISGDEFAVVLADLARQEDAALVAQKVIDRLAAPVAVHGQEVFVTASIGVATFPGDGEDAETLIGAADAAMYRAKQAGRNAFQFFTAEINARSRARAQMGVELRHALERREFLLLFQPKFDLASGKPCAAEALLRWKHPERGIVSPAEFIPVLEETGLIVEVGEWVLQRACQEIKDAVAAGCAAMPIAVNISARQFRQQDLDKRLRAIVQANGVDSSLVELEITESQLMHDPAHAIRIMRALAEAGIRVAIDDFGTGYSSLAYLSRFPVSSLKVDRSFVAGLMKEGGDATIVKTIIDMAHSLRFTVVAEGVETQEQAEALRRLGCEQAQGFLFARPLSSADYRALLAKSG
ncbi:MAG TPA: EAL domain-containing protein [Burkholderiales bacterium]|nr:EAL domain-containing protein [Burkholderiales bacterium]